MEREEEREGRRDGEREKRRKLEMSERVMMVQMIAKIDFSMIPIDLDANYPDNGISMMAGAACKMAHRRKKEKRGSRRRRQKKKGRRREVKTKRRKTIIWRLLIQEFEETT